MASDNQLLIEIKATTELLRSQLSRADAEVAKFERGTNKRLAAVDDAFEKAGEGAGGLKDSLAAFAGGAIAGLTAQFSVENVTRFADEYAQLTAKLKLATAEFGSFATAQVDVNRIATETRSQTVDVADLYSKLVRAAKPLGKSQADVATATETVTRALKVSGASSAEASSAILQLGQALGSGVLRGEEFNAIYEASPLIMDLLAKSLGVPIGQLRKMAEEGKLTSKVVFGALTDPQNIADVKKSFAQIPPTFADAMTGVQNAARAAFGGFAKGGEFSTILNGFATEGSADLNSIGDSAERAGKKFRILIDAIKDFANSNNTFVRLSNKLIEIENRLGRIANPITGGFAIASEIEDFQNRPRLRNFQNTPSVTFETPGGGVRRLPGVAAPRGPLPGLKPLKGAAGVFGGGGALALAGIDFSEVIRQLPQVKRGIGAASVAQSRLNGEVGKLLSAIREEGRLTLLRAEGRDREADLIEDLVRAAEDVERIEGLTNEERQEALVLVTAQVQATRALAGAAQEASRFAADFADSFGREDGDFLRDEAARNDAERQRKFDDAEELARKREDDERVLAGLFYDLFDGGTKRLWANFRQIGLDVISQVLARLVGGQSLGSIFGGGSGGIGAIVGAAIGFGGFRANGGPVIPGKAYVVGERGPELIVPRVPASVVSNGSLSKIGGGGVTISIDARGAQAGVADQIADALRTVAPMIVEAAHARTIRTLTRETL